MKLNHLTLAVDDVLAAKDFLMRYFGLEERGGNKGMSFLSDSDGLLLVLIKDKSAQYSHLFHIGFGQPSEAKVDELNARLKADGYDVNPPERSHAYTFYVKAPGGFLVEIMAG